jgi:cold shock protein
MHGALLWLFLRVIAAELGLAFQCYSVTPFYSRKGVLVQHCSRRFRRMILVVQAILFVPNLASRRSSSRLFADGSHTTTGTFSMITGTVKFFNTDKGYGFIAPETGGNDAFVHISAVERAGMTTLNKDQRVSYDLETDQRGKTSAVNLQAA